MKITMYELLGMIKDGKAPERIIYDKYVYELNEDRKNYEREIDPLTTLNWDYIVINCLNEQVKILEEEKKIPEEIKVKDYDKCIHDVTHKEKEFSLDIRELQIRYNDLLDYLKSKGE